MTEDTPRYWFRAKRYGWGWGLPATWQGWIVLIGFIAGMTADGIVFAPRSLWAFYAVTLVLSAILIGICWLKGEPPRWRWGK